MNAGAPLAYKNVPRLDELAAETLHAQSLSLTVPTVSGAASRLFMCHF
jgi:hypothetical protein